MSRKRPETCQGKHCGQASRTALENKFCGCWSTARSGLLSSQRETRADSSNGHQSRTLETSNKLWYPKS